MGFLAAFIVGALLGWVISWVLQKRLDDNLIDEVAQLQRQIVEYQRQIEALQNPEADAVEEAVAKVLSDGLRTADIARGAASIGTGAMGAAVIERLSA